MVEVREFREADQAEIVALVLCCQNDGTRPPVTAEGQPELLDLERSFRSGGGNFWVAEEDGAVVGSIGLMLCGNGVGILKKFFVSEPYRGTPHHLGRRLYAVLLDWAGGCGLRRLILDTPKNTARAHRFYETAGFQKLRPDEVPVVYDHPYADSDFFSLELPTP